MDVPVFVLGFGVDRGSRGVVILVVRESRLDVVIC